jgi:ATP-binding cassette, subfamily B, bacterial PglK
MLETLKKLQDILPIKDKIKLAFLFILMIIGGFLEALSIGVVAGFVAVIASPEILFEIEIISRVLTALQIEDSRDILLYGSLALIAIFVFKNSYLVFYNYIKSRFIFNRYKSISERLFMLYMNVPYSFHLRRNSAELIRNVTNESRVLATNVMLPILQIATECVMALGIIILLLIIEPFVTIITIFLLGGISFAFLRFTKVKMQKYGKEALDERSKIIKTVNEGVGGFKDATIMNRQNWFVKNFEKSIAILAKTHIFQEATKKSVRPIIETIAITGMLLIALFLLNQGHTIGTLASILALFALSIQRLLPAINNIIGEYNSLRYHIYALDPIHKDITTLTEYLKENGKKEEKKIPLKEKIELKDVDFSYEGSKESVLKNINITIKKGSAVGLVGSTGSGKTTLVDLVLGLLSPNKGAVLVDNENIQKNVSNWQKNIGYIPQFIYLSDDTIRNNIAFGINEEEINEAKIKKAVEVAHLEEFIEKLPKGLDTFIGERGIRLSGGQRQRIGIARALYDNPEILVMDEATSSLDNITEKFVIEAIEKLKKDRTIIIIAHRLTTVKNCDTLYILKDGKIIAQGNYEKLLKENKDFQKMVDSDKSN